MAVAVVSDASPIMNLAAVGRLDLLRQLGGEIRIPEAVRDEMVRGWGLPGAKEVETEPWIVTERVVDRTQVALLGAELDEGEAGGRRPRVAAPGGKSGASCGDGRVTWPCRV